MTKLFYDHDRLHDAVVLLLHPRFGAARTAQVRERIKMLPQRTSKFHRALEPLNEIMRVAMQDAIKALNLIDLADRRRVKTAEAVEATSPEVMAARKQWATRVATARARLRKAAAIEEALQDKKFTTEERAEFMKQTSHKWKLERDAFRKAGGLTTSAAHSEFSRLLDERLEKAYVYAQQNRGIKAMSSVAVRNQNAAKTKAKTTQDMLNKHFRGK